VNDPAPAAPKKDLSVTLSIVDNASGFTMEAKKPVSAYSNAFKDTLIEWKADKGEAP
jgi:hypothetical protein